MSNHASTLRLQRFAPEHAASIMVWPQSITEAQWWAGQGVPWPVPLESLQRWHTDPDVHPFVLADGATAVGYGELWVDADEQEVELARLIVAPTHRRRGVGQRLLQLLLAEAAPTHYAQAFLRVVAENHAAIGCYTKAGFTLTSSKDQQRFNQGQPVAYTWMFYPLHQQDV